MNQFESVLRTGVGPEGEQPKMSPAMKDAFEKANNAAANFAQEHPLYGTIIAWGILVILAPGDVEALGFGELRSIKGTFAAWCQAQNAGYMPQGSLFSFFQRLGMVWGRKSSDSLPWAATGFSARTGAGNTVLVVHTRRRSPPPSTSNRLRHVDPARNGRFL